MHCWSLAHINAKKSATGSRRSIGVRVGSVASVVELSLALAKASRAVSATIPRAPLLSRRGGGFGCRRWFRRCRRACFLGVTLVEAINAPGGIYQFLFARKKRVARRADFHLQIGLARRARRECFAAGTLHVNVLVLWMDFLFHVPLTFSSLV